MVYRLYVSLAAHISIGTRKRPRRDGSALLSDPLWCQPVEDSVYKWFGCCQLATKAENAGQEWNVAQFIEFEFEYIGACPASAQIVFFAKQASDVSDSYQRYGEAPFKGGRARFTFEGRKGEFRPFRTPGNVYEVKASLFVDGLELSSEDLRVLGRRQKKPKTPKVNPPIHVAAPGPLPFRGNASHISEVPISIFDQYGKQADLLAEDNTYTVKIDTNLQTLVRVIRVQSKEQGIMLPEDNYRECILADASAIASFTQAMAMAPASASVAATAAPTESFFRLYIPKFTTRIDRLFLRLYYGTSAHDGPVYDHDLTQLLPRELGKFDFRNVALTNEPVVAQHSPMQVGPYMVDQEKAEGSDAMDASMQIFGKMDMAQAQMVRNECSRDFRRYNVCVRDQLARCLLLYITFTPKTDDVQPLTQDHLEEFKELVISPLRKLTEVDEATISQICNPGEMYVALLSEFDLDYPIGESIC